MYEQLRNDLMVELSTHLGNDTVRMVLSSLDSVAVNYEVHKRETSLVPYNGNVELAQMYLISRSIEGLSKTTAKTYGQILNVFMRTLQKPLNTLDVNDVRAWLYWYQNQNHVSNRTLELYREILNGFFKWATGEGYLEKNPCDKIRTIKYEHKQKPAMEQIELERIRAACANERDTAIVELFYSTGCRVSELIRLKKSDVDFNSKEVMLFGKGNKHRISYLNAKATLALQTYLSSRSDEDDHLIVSSKSPHGAVTKAAIEQTIKRIVERSGVDASKRVTPHTFRHTTATTALQAGMPVQDVQRILGHAKLDTVMVYAEVSQSQVKSSHTRCIL